MIKRTVPHKGEWDYPIRQKKLAIAKTLLEFALGIIMFLTGYLTTGTKANLLTICAVLMMLPASRSAVVMIMFLKVPRFDEALYHKIDGQKGNVLMLYHLYLTSYKVNYPITCFAVAGGNVIGYSEFASCDANACGAHIADIIKRNGIRHCNIKVFGSNDYRMFEERLRQLQDIEPMEQDSELLSLLCDISL